MNDTMQIDAEQREVSPLQRHGRIEADTFCDQCGYNLHSQPVVRDERLGILVARCPECGGWHAAGKGTAAASLWLSRLATFALAFWVLVVLSAVVWLCVGFGAVMVLHADEFSFRHQVAADGREVEWSNVAGTGNMMVYRGTTQPAQAVRNVRRIELPAEMRMPEQLEWRRQQLMIGSMVLGLSDLGLGLVAGILLVTFFWHWNRGRYRIALVLPFIVAAFVLAVMLLADDDYAEIQGWVTSRVLFHAAVQALFMYLGILIGRPVARGLLRTIIPPRPRQLFAFLWQADGKAMPPARIPARM